jgi:hypothetical protein
MTACSSSTPAPFQSRPPVPGDVIAARTIAEDPTFDPSVTRRPRFVPCQGLSGCARSSPATGEYYPGVIVPSPVDASVDYSQEFVLYLTGASFDQATLEGTTIHVRLATKPRGFQMVKLDGQGVLTVGSPAFSFENEGGTVICTSGWEGCS